MMWVLDNTVSAKTEIVQNTVVDDCHYRQNVPSPIHHTFLQCQKAVTAYLKKKAFAGF